MKTAIQYFLVSLWMMAPWWAKGAALSSYATTNTVTDKDLIPILSTNASGHFDNRNVSPASLSNALQVVGRMNGTATNLTLASTATLSTNVALRAWSGADLPGGKGYVSLIDDEWHATEENIIRLGQGPMGDGVPVNAIAMCIAGHGSPQWSGGMGLGGYGPRFAITYFLGDGTRDGWTFGETNILCGSDNNGTFEVFSDNLTNTIRWGAQTFTNDFVGTQIDVVATNALNIVGGGGNSIVFDNVGQAINITAGTTVFSFGPLGVAPGSGLLIGGGSYFANDGTFLFGGSGVVSGSLEIDGSPAVTLGSGGPIITTYSGNPNTHVTASPGSICTSTAGGAGVTLWVKESGTGNTGWVSK